MKNGNVIGFRGYRFFSPKSSKAKYKTLGTSGANFGGKKTRIILREVRYAERNVCMFFIIINKIYLDIFPPQDETHPFSHSNTLEARSVHVSVCTRNDVVT